MKAWANGEMVLPKLISISSAGTGKYYASYGVEQLIQPKLKTGSRVGIDMGSRKLATLSEGGVVENPKFLKGLLKTLRIRQKSLSRQRKSSNRWKEQAKRVAKVHAKIRDSRRDYRHKATTKIVEKQDLIVVESLCVKNRVRNARLAPTLHDASMSEFISMLEDKCAWYGKEFIKIDQWYRSSKTCSCCGHKLDELAPVEFWTCPTCKTEHDRDFNASKNILAEGLRIRAGLSEFNARGEFSSGSDHIVEQSETRLVEGRIVVHIEPMSGTAVRYA